jgi:hypothetical protein
MNFVETIIICSSIALIISLYKILNCNHNIKNYKPLTQDKKLFKKIIFILSQSTYQLNFIILFAYIAKYLKQNYLSNILLKIGFVNLITSIIFYWIIFRRYKAFHEIFTYDNMYLHFFVLILCIYDVFQNSNLKFSFNDLKFTTSYFVILFLFNIINYNVRNKWSYGLLQFINPFKNYTGYLYFFTSFFTSIIIHIIIGKIKKNIN